MLEPAIQILDDHRMMAISTVRPDGWPQVTMVGYANDGWNIYFLIFRDSQKFANIGRDDRVAVAVSADTSFLGEIKAVYAGAHSAEVMEPKERLRAWNLLLERHPNLGEFGVPDNQSTALMRARCKYVSMLDYSQGIGHSEELTVGENGPVAT